jgi:hypothetical protein
MNVVCGITGILNMNVMCVAAQGFWTRVKKFFAKEVDRGKVSAYKRRNLVTQL